MRTNEIQISDKLLNLSVVRLEALKGLIKSTAVTIKTTPTKVPEYSLMNRKTVVIYNDSSEIIYIGGADVRTVDGLPIYPKDNLAIDVSEQITIYAIAGSNASCRILEVS